MCEKIVLQRLSLLDENVLPEGFPQHLCMNPKIFPRITGSSTPAGVKLAMLFSGGCIIET